MIKKIDHVAIDVESIDELIPFYRDKLGLSVGGSMEAGAARMVYIPVNGVNVILTQLKEREAGKAAEGLYQISLEVDDLAAAIKEYARKGLIAAETEPRAAPGGQVAYLDQAKTHGIRIQLIQRT
ncbi:MAG: VOC family protein [Chloroflexi bacterium]|nr:VOC family protein [Chloroflexota bacterium]